MVWMEIFVYFIKVEHRYFIKLTKIESMIQCKYFMHASFFKYQGLFNFCTLSLYEKLIPRLLLFCQAFLSKTKIYHITYILNRYLLFLYLKTFALDGVYYTYIK